MFDALAGADAATSTLLIVGLLVAFGFEFVNGSHDTARINARQNAIATRLERIGFGVTNEWRLQR
jgi:phosphate/sulfate permease